MKKLFIVLISSMCCFLSLNSNVFAASGIPEKMPVDTLIKYTSDNCKYNTTVKVSLPKKSGGLLSRDMKKRDAGEMPNAIVDIWKTGVAYWGYSYSINLSINDATIWHN